MRTFPKLLTLAALSAAALACSRGDAPSDSRKAAAPQVAPAVVAEKKVEPPKPSIEDNTFKLSLSAPGYNGGKEGKLSLTLEARGGYHVNADYPIRIDLKAPGDVKLDKTTLGKEDASQFSEASVLFEQPFSATAGAHDLVATVDFAVCTKETCLPDQRTVALALQVQ